MSVAAVVLAVVAPTLQVPPPPIICSRVVSPSGSDRAAGSPNAPFRTISRVTAALRPGETGCIRAGVYFEDVKMTVGGRPGAPVTIRSYPAERATIDGRLWIARGADHVVVSALNLDGAPSHGANPDRLPSPTVNASNVIFDGDDITSDHSGICFVLGSDTFGRAEHTAIRNSRIHDCGRLPPSNHDHGIYVEYADRADIEADWIYSNADRGIQLYPDAQRTTIARNVIDGNGEGIIFSGDDGRSSSGNVVEHNLITNATVRADVESFYPVGTPPGTANVVRGNCIYGGRQAVQQPSSGFSLEDDLFADPGYVDAARHDYRLRRGSPCAALAVPPPP